MCRDYHFDRIFLVFGEKDLKATTSIVNQGRTGLSYLSLDILDQFGELIDMVIRYRQGLFDGGKSRTRNVGHAGSRDLSVGDSHHQLVSTAQMSIEPS
mmetsp:Transcript_81466/g.228511  ORF Transcript_81466/g.228511 Transcript_81466/m.228511 type:complete len:98 (-) Transcript_81466:926-1219(-)